MVRVRFAPSPTGYLHIGGARTCLFNWLYARKMGGKFILRIEDTDVERSKAEYRDEILESIAWLGMNWDEIYSQSERFDIYRQYARKLIDSGHAAEKDGAVFFKYEFDSVEIDDLIRGKIVFNELPKEEEVIIKSDNTPTYNFCCVIDDAMMNINPVIRGEDHISNTPKQILMYKALGFDPPKFAHVPLILSPDGGRMSKRHGATSIREYRQMGFLSDALVNYFLLLGWSVGADKEIISLDEAKHIFDISHVNKTGAAFSMEKLCWMNAQYLHKKTLPQLADLLGDFLKDKNFLPAGTSRQHLEKCAGLFRERLVTLADFIDAARFCFYNDFTYSEDAAPALERNLSKEVSALVSRLSGLTDFSHTAVEAEFRACCQDQGLKVKELVHPVRVGLTGKKIGPGLFESMEFLGKDEVVARLNRLIRHWSDKNN